MNSKKFEYLNKDVPMLKKDITFRLVLMGLFVFVFVWQFIMFIIEYGNKTLNLGKILATIFVMLFSLTFAMLSLLYALKSYKNIGIIKKRGKCVSSVIILFDLNNSGWIKLIYFVTSVITLALSLAVVSIITYSILQFAYFSNISFFIPMLLSLTIMGFNSVYHIRNEINVVKTVKLYNAMY